MPYPEIVLSDPTKKLSTRKAKPFISPVGYAGMFTCLTFVGYIFFGPEQAGAQAQEGAVMAQCALLYSDPHFNDLTFGMTEEKQLCRRRLHHFRDMVQTQYSITGSAFRLTDSTHSLVGLSVARSRPSQIPAKGTDLFTLGIFFDEKLVATMQFGQPEAADKAYREISDAIATAQMLKILAAPAPR